MKKVKLNIGLIMMAFATLLFVNCGGSESDDGKLKYDVDWNSLTYDKKADKYLVNDSLFTGVAAELNSEDSLLNYGEFKNGFVIKMKSWEDFGGKLVLTADMEYKDNRDYNGWFTKMEGNLKEGYKVTKEYIVYQNGMKVESLGWDLSAMNSRKNYKNMLKVGDEYYDDCEALDGREYYECLELKDLPEFHFFYNK